MNFQIPFSETLCLNGIMYYRQAAYDEAIIELEKARKIDKNNIGATYYLAKCYESKGEIDKALQFAKKIKDSGYADSLTFYKSLEQRQ